MEEELDHCQRFVNSERSIFQLSTPQLCILEKVFISLNNYYLEGAVDESELNPEICFHYAV